MIDEKDIQKLMKDEMNLFGKFKTVYPNLNNYEDQIKGQFLTHYKIFLKNLKHPVYIENFFLVGLILRSLNLYRGCLLSFTKHNPHVFALTLRAQCETLALIHYCNKNPKYITIALTGKIKVKNKEKRIERIGKMIKELNKKYKRIEEDYDQLCERVHPNPKSLLTNIKPLSKKGGIRIGTKIPVVDKEHSEKYLKMLVFWTEWIFKEIDDLTKKIPIDKSLPPFLHKKQN